MVEEEEGRVIDETAAIPPTPPLITFFAVLRCLRTDRALRFAFFDTRRRRLLTRRFVTTRDGILYCEYILCE